LGVKPANSILGTKTRSRDQLAAALRSAHALPRSVQRSHQFAQVLELPFARICVSGSVSMSTKAEYRANAEDCLRKAQNAQHEQEKPFWLNLAQSWLHLAQYSTQNRLKLDVNKAGVGLNESSAQAARGACPSRRHIRP
jgi:hypothetical protein